jgi:hypothetical protein
MSKIQSFKPTSTAAAYKEALDFLGGRLARKVDHNTRMCQAGESVSVDLHGHTILTYLPEGIRVSSCGYKTHTTKERLNAFLPSGYNVCQKDFEWYVLIRPQFFPAQGEDMLSKVVPFVNGMLLKG